MEEAGDLRPVGALLPQYPDNLLLAGQLDPFGQRPFGTAQMYALRPLSVQRLLCTLADEITLNLS